MQLAHRVALNGVQLDSIDSRIIIKSVEEGAGKESISAVSRASGSGQRITGRRRDTLDIVVKFSLNIDEADMQERSEALEAVNRWASAGGLLTLNYKPGRQIRVILAQAPGAGDPWEWTNVYSLTFRAYGVPYWEDAAGASVRQQGVSSGSLTLGVNGSAETVMDVSFKNTSGSTVNTFSVTAGGKTIALTGLGLANNATLTIDHDENGLIRMKIGSTSVLDKRTAESADDLTVKPGAVSVSFTAGGAGTIQVTCKGRYL